MLSVLNAGKKSVEPTTPQSHGRHSNQWAAETTIVGLIAYRLPGICSQASRTTSQSLPLWWWTICLKYAMLLSNASFLLPVSNIQCTSYFMVHTQGSSGPCFDFLRQTDLFHTKFLQRFDIKRVIFSCMTWQHIQRVLPFNQSQVLIFTADCYSLCPYISCLPAA